MSRWELSYCVVWGGVGWVGGYLMGEGGLREWVGQKS